MLLANANVMLLHLWSSYSGCHLLACRAGNAVRSLHLDSRGFLPENPKGTTFVPSILCQTSFIFCRISLCFTLREIWWCRCFILGFVGVFFYSSSCHFNILESLLVILGCMQISSNFQKNKPRFNEIRLKSFRTLCSLSIYRVLTCDPGHDFVTLLNFFMARHVLTTPDRDSI